MTNDPIRVETKNAQQTLFSVIGQPAQVVVVWCGCWMTNSNIKTTFSNQGQIQTISEI